MESLLLALMGLRNSNQKFAISVNRPDQVSVALGELRRRKWIKMLDVGVSVAAAGGQLVDVFLVTTAGAKQLPPSGAYDGALYADEFDKVAMEHPRP